MKALMEEYEGLGCLSHISYSNRHFSAPLVFKLGVFKLRAEVGQQIWRKKASNPTDASRCFFIGGCSLYSR